MELNYNQHSPLSSTISASQQQAYQQLNHQKPLQNPQVPYQHNHNLQNHHHSQHHAPINNSPASQHNVAQHNVAQHAGTPPSGVPHQQFYYYPTHLGLPVHQQTQAVSHPNHQRQSPVNHMSIPKSSSQPGVTHHTGSSSKSSSHRGVSSSTHQMPGGHTVPGPGPGGVVVPPPIQVAVPVPTSVSTPTGQQSSAGGAGSGGRSFAAALRNLAKQAGPSGQEEERGAGASARQAAASPKQQMSQRHSAHNKRDVEKQEKESRASTNPQHAPPSANAAVPPGQEPRSGFQPYRPEEPRIAPPAFPSPLDYPPYPHHHHPAAAAAALYPPHLQHAYRVEEQLYLERCGALSLFPLTYPPALYGLMPSLPLMSPSMHDRMKMEDEHRARERAQEERDRTERERDKERREKNKRSPRASPSHHSSSEHGRKSCSSANSSNSNSGAGAPQFVRPFEDSFSNKPTAPPRHGAVRTPPTTANPSVSPSIKAVSPAHQNHAGRSSPYGHYTTRHTTTQSLAPGIPPVITTAPMVLPHHQMAPPHLVNTVSELSPLLPHSYPPKPLPQTTPPETVRTSPLLPPLRPQDASPSGLRHTPPISQPPMHLYAPNHMDHHAALSHLGYTLPPPPPLLNHYPPVEIGAPTYVPLVSVTAGQLITPVSSAPQSAQKSTTPLISKHTPKTNVIQESTHLTSASNVPPHETALPVSTPVVVTPKKSVISTAPPPTKSSAYPVVASTNVTTANVTVTTTTVTTVTNHTSINNCRPLDVANLVVQPLCATMPTTVVCSPVTSTIAPVSSTVITPTSVFCSSLMSHLNIEPNVSPCKAEPDERFTAPVITELTDVKPETMEVCYNTATPSHQPPPLSQDSAKSEDTKPDTFGVNGSEYQTKKHPFPLWDCRGSAQRKSLSKLEMIADRDNNYDGMFQLTKGPPDKLDAPPKKVHFLAIFGLTTLAKRNELELRKLTRRNAVPPVEIDEMEDKTTKPAHTSGSEMCHSAEKLSFMNALGLTPLTQKQKEEKEQDWQDVLAERKRRRSDIPLTLDNQSVKQSKWSGIDDVMTSYIKYERETSLELSVLREEKKRLKTVSTETRQEIAVLEKQLDDLNLEQGSLQIEEDSLRSSVDMLSGVIKDITDLTR